MNRKLSILLVFNILFCINKIDINNSGFEELYKLPLDKDKIIAIKQYIIENNEIHTIYDLQNVKSLTAEDIHLLKDYIVINHKKESLTRSNLSYKIDQWLSNEGGSEGISEFWLDRYYNQQNVNTMNYDDLSTLPNFSPMDVLAILKQQKRGEIKGTWQLKNSPGISYYGYKNLLDFVQFKDDEKSKIDIRYHYMSRSLPSTSGVDEDEIPISYLDSNRPENMQKLFIGYGHFLKTGFLRHNNLGDSENLYNDKAFISFEKINLNKFRIDKIILGNFNATFGQGVVFQSGDYYQPRNTGYGFSKRQTGINYDLTRSSQFTLSGYAAQVSSEKLRFSIFYSDGSLIDNNKRDAIINADGSFTSFISMKPRLDYGYYNNQIRYHKWDNLDCNAEGAPLDCESKKAYNIYSEDECLGLSGNSNDIQWGGESGSGSLSRCYDIAIHESMINAVEERTLGGNLRVHIDDSFNFELSAYESLYDRVLNPQIINSVVGGEDDFTDGFDAATDWDAYSGDGVYAEGYMSNSADPEIRAMYSNSGYADYWDKAKSYRRVFGAGFSKVIGKMSIQGEYGQLDLKGARDPKAYVLNAYMQFDTFNLLVLYRDYDLHFDNPYQKSFSEYKRYKSTIFEDSYWLEDPILSNLHTGSSQPQAEKGFYIESRYQFHEDLVAGIQWDSWIRKADNAQYYRIVNKLEWRPLFNYRIYFRYKLQSRGSFNITHPSPYFTKEARIRFKIRLSNYDNLELLYAWNYTSFSPMPPLTTPPNPMYGNEMTQGDIGSPDVSLGFSLEHNFSKHMKMKLGAVYVSGFLWYIEDNDFRLFNSNDGLSHTWVSFNVKPNSMFTIKLKISHSSDYPTTKIVSGQTDAGYWIDNPYLYDQKTNYKFQIDYAL